MTQAQALPQAQYCEIGGVPVFYSDVPGPARAGLVFRVGWSDERIPQRGLSHLVEHLGLIALGQRSHLMNGMVEENRTSFFCEGSRPEVTDFLTSLTKTISTPSLGRLEAERRILAIESESRGQSAIDALRAWRFGTKGPGAGSFGEFGLRTVSAQDVSDWARTWFTSGNAALWMTCPPPPDLALALPHGPRRPVQRVTPFDLPLPAHIPGGDAGLAASMIVPRQVDSAAVEWILQRRLFERLRIQDAVSYSITVRRRAIDDLNNELFVVVDGLPDSQQQLESGVLEVLRNLAIAGCGAAEIEEWRTTYVRPLSDPAAIAGVLHTMATDNLNGQLAKQAGNLAYEAAQVSSESIRTVVSDAFDKTLFCVPSGSPVIAATFAAAPNWSPTTVAGTTFRPTNPNSVALLHVGASGISYARDAERRVTVTWDACAAVLRWDDGGRRVLGTDGTWLDLPPQAWRDFPRLSAEIDRWTRPEWVVDMGAAPPRPAPPLPRSKVLGGASTSLIVTLAVSLAVCAILFGALGLKAFLVAGLPCLAAAALCGREVYLRRTGVHGAGNGSAPRLSRPLRHMPRQVLWLTLALSLGFAVASGAAASSGTNVGPLPFGFGLVGIRVLLELLRRPHTATRRR